MNRRTLKDMQAALNRGGQLLWIAPSGGRDRSISPENGALARGQASLPPGLHRDPVPGDPSTHLSGGVSSCPPCGP